MKRTTVTQTSTVHFVHKIEQVFLYSQWDVLFMSLQLATLILFFSSLLMFSIMCCFMFAWSGWSSYVQWPDVLVGAKPRVTAVPWPPTLSSLPGDTRLVLKNGGWPGSSVPKMPIPAVQVIREEELQRFGTACLVAVGTWWENFTKKKQKENSICEKYQLTIWLAEA